MDFLNFRDEISVASSFLLKGQRIIIPKGLRKEMLERIHVGHMRIEKSKIRARDAIFWLGMNKDMEDLIKICNICQEMGFSDSKEPMFTSSPPTRPWEFVATDLFQFEQDN